MDVTPQIATPAGPAPSGAHDGPLLPRSQLISISIYWFGINAIWGGYEIFGQHKVEQLVGTATRGATLGYVEIAAALVSVAVQPTIGTISDYFTSRWGRRKPFILIGGILDVIFIIGIATSQSVLALAAFLLLLSFSSNFAQGPFQGYVPDLVPERQVNTASAMLGAMRTLGVIGGAAIVSVGATTGDFAFPFIVIGFIELALALLTVALVKEGPVARQRNGKSWRTIATEAWGMDALRERGFVFMTLTRLFFLMGAAAFVNFGLYYVRDSLGLQGPEQTLWLALGPGAIAVGAVVGTVPSAWLAGRIGRKSVIWLAAATSAIGLVLIARATQPVEALPGLLLLGFGTGGYLAVDWALMTSTIPRLASGRYMGLANIANSISGPIAVVVGGRVLDEVTRTAGLDVASRVTILTGLIFLAVASVMLIPVKPRTEPPIEIPD